MNRKIVKVCGLKTEDAANTAIESGASLLGTILVPNRARTVDSETAKRLSKLCYEKRIKNGSKFAKSEELLKFLKSLDIYGPEWFEEVANHIVENGPYLVGVFRNQSIEDVKNISQELNIDIIQLHGSENVDEYVSELKLPVIPRFVLNKPGISNALKTHKFLIPLLDSESGGEGKLISWDDATKFGSEMNGRYILAGGLTPENVASALSVEGCYGVDVSGGVETDGQKDTSKIQQFVQNGCLTNVCT
ncbi:bifunctional tryptophan synthase trp1 [Pichia californica]|uniref:N-(5'-phosphoribosyl)anthranilate isomerase n=1 Tax=Pichia californica TaxID=460514 RepID=A0A9P6WND8_9ASCO|nr:bifunctional tryptophan synthase trp1 [[Candida] californica]KAG0690194.1 bifunctional tryptophan synthase trp1 [[Candida] californica]